MPNTKVRTTPEWDRLRLLLSERRMRLGLTQNDVAAALAQPQSYVSNFELGYRKLDVFQLLDVAAALDMDARALIAMLRRARTSC